MENRKIIKCPHCGAEYLAAEIFLKTDLIGNPKDIERDVEGRIIFVDGAEECFTTKYTCDGCNRLFEVSANVEYTSTPIVREHKTLKEEKLILEEI